MDIKSGRRLQGLLATKQEDISRFTDASEQFFESIKDYSLPIETNLRFMENISKFENKEGQLSTKHPEVISAFNDIIQGEVGFSDTNQPFFVPDSNKNIKLSMDESSSSIRALLDLGFYLKKIANDNDIIIIDEPEMNLHPQNQRKFARLLARLVNIGVKVFITTHSDYIIKEFNTLIMLNKKDERLKRVAKKYGFQASELLDSKKIRLYIAETVQATTDSNAQHEKYSTLTRAKISPETGIEASTFDTTIEEMNSIEGEIIWGD